MLHIVTAHFKTPRWIPIQARQLQRHLTVPHRVWGSLEQVDSSYRRYFDRVDEGSGSHAEKLNRIAAEIAAEAADDDLLMFLDGDAFPVADPVPLIESGLESAPLVAVRRTENGGDPQPHPCFCVTSVELWCNLPGDWSEGFTWTGPLGEPETDVGANLLHQLELSGTPWTPILRSNRHDLHRLFFGVYGDAIYHHGAGFRAAFSRADLAELIPDEWARSPSVREALARNDRNSMPLFRLLQRDNPDWLPAVRASLARTRRESEALFERIQRDEPGWLADLT
jgi:hypothetical protein